MNTFDIYLKSIAFLWTHRHEELVNDISEYLNPKDPAEIIHKNGGLIDMNMEKLVAIYIAMPWEAQKIRQQYLKENERFAWWSYSWRIRMEKFDYYLSIGHYYNTKERNISD